MAWGINVNGETDVPPGSDYTEISAGTNGGLAMTNTGSVVEWGQTDGSVPSGAGYLAVSSGQFWNLFLAADGTLSSSGSDMNGDTDVPGGDNYFAIAAGGNQGVAIQVPEPTSAMILMLGAAPPLLRRRRS